MVKNIFKSTLLKFYVEVHEIAETWMEKHYEIRPHTSSQGLPHCSFVEKNT